MKKLLIIALIFIPFGLSAQSLTLLADDEAFPTMIERILEKHDSTRVETGRHRIIKTHINLELVTSMNAYFTQNNFDDISFKTNRVRMEFYGKLNDNLSYHYRQSLTNDNFAASIEYANIKWHHSDKFELVAGKQYVAFAGYEGYVNGIKVREFCEFNEYTEIYRTGVMGTIYFTPTQLLMLQLTNNRSHFSTDVLLNRLPEGVEPTKTPLLLNANWNGFFADGTVHLMYSASAGQQAKGKYIYYLMCGNIYEKGPVLAYFDVLYSRSALDVQQRVTSLCSTHSPLAQNTQYLSFIADVDYQFHPKWNAYVKGAYETASVYRASDMLAKGRYITSWNAQACLEWFPFSQDKGFKLFAHYLYKGHHLTDKANALIAYMPHTQRASIGIQYIIPVL